MTAFVSGAMLASIAALMGDVARANILAALMDGRALTAGELAHHAGVTAATTSGHLAKLLDGGLIALERQGRHRYYRLASREVAEAIEGLMAITGVGPPRHRPTGPRDAAMRAARSCYDHMAGRLGTGLADALVAAGHIEMSDGSAIVTEPGWRFLAGLDIDAAAAAQATRPLCRTCLDWSERRPHLAGWLGRALFDRALALGWVARLPRTRALRVTEGGRVALRGRLGFDPL